jgi:hypothetical protein
VVTTSSPLPGALSGVPYFEQLEVAGGVPPYVWSVVSSAAPAGINLSPASGALSGSSTALGTASFGVRVTDANGAQSVTKTLDLTVATSGGALTLVTGLPPATLNVPYSATVTAIGGTPPYTFSAIGTVPTGLTLDATTGTLSGTPTTATSMQVRVTDSAPLTPAFVDTLALVVVTPLSIDQTSLPGGNVGSGYATALTASGGNGAQTWTLAAGSLPAGLSLNNAGAFSGAPQTAGAFTFRVQVADVSGNVAQKQLTLTVGGPVTQPASSGGGGGGGCGLLGLEVALVWLWRRRRRS